jgi:outer membrane protein OmpA-like peptidoglycan-associated protein
LNNVFFDFGKYDLRPESYPELDRLAEFLKSNTSLRIELGGHTDNVGKDADNLTLSQNRVNSVMSYVASRGVDAARLTAKGYGETKPVNTNDTEEGRQQNRRVEFTILQ